MKLVGFNILLSGLALSCLSTVSFAYQNASSFDGFYVGASVGGTSTSVNQDKTVDYLIDAPGVDIGAIIVLHQTGPIALKTNNSFKGALYAGWGQTCNNWYLGAEIFADVAQYKNLNAVEEDTWQNDPLALFLSTENQADTHTKLSNFQFGIDLRPGVLLTPDSMLYGRIGVAISDLDLNTNATFAGFNPADPLSWVVLLPLSVKKDVAALRLGGGLEQHICPCLNVRLDYIFTYYGKASIAGSAADGGFPRGNDPTAVFRISSDTSVKVYNNTVMLGLTYLIN
jgi:Outer membrane protein beta-barrel domain